MKSKKAKIKKEQQTLFINKDLYIGIMNSLVILMEEMATDVVTITHLKLSQREKDMMRKILESNLEVIGNVYSALDMGLCNVFEETFINKNKLN